MVDGIDSALLGRLLGLMAHDLRNPLAAIHSNLGYVEGGAALDADGREALSDAIVSCDAIAHIIDNLEILGAHLRVEAPPVEQRFDAGALIPDVVVTCGAAARSHDVRLVQAPHGEPALALGDRELSRRALTNLVRNSIQLSPAGSEIVLSVEGRGERVIVRVDDGGEPPPPALAEAVFTAVGQIEGKTKPGGRYSRGLGLMAARLAAERGGATVAAVAARDGYRSAFELSLRRG